MIDCKLLTMTDDLNHPGLKQFKRSLDEFKWNYEVIKAKYKAFGSKQVAFYNYFKENTELKYAFITDAHDMFVLGYMNEALNKVDFDSITFNAEKACWPYADWADSYPQVNTKWKYLNGGAAFVNTKRYIQLFEENPIKHSDNDQVNLARIFLDQKEKYNFKLDTDCTIFQSIAFEHDGDFTYNKGKLINNYTNTVPNIIHGNGKTNMNKIYNLI